MKKTLFIAALVATSLSATYNFENVQRVDDINNTLQTATKDITLSGRSFSITKIGGSTSVFDLAKVTADDLEATLKSKVEKVVIIDVIGNASSKSITVKNSNGNTSSIDMESWFNDLKEGSLDIAGKKIILTLNDGTTVDVDVAPIVDNLLTDTLRDSIESKKVADVTSTSTGITVTYTDGTTSSIALAEGGDVNVNLDTVAYDKATKVFTYTLTDGTKKTVTLDIDKSDIGLGNVDNTSDINKPISTATQTALDLKVDTEAGKGLSSNDLTDALVDKIEAVKVASLSGSKDSLNVTMTDGTTSTIDISDVSGVSVTDITCKYGIATVLYSNDTNSTFPVYDCDNIEPVAEYNFNGDLLVDDVARQDIVIRTTEDMEYVNSAYGDETFTEISGKYGMAGHGNIHDIALETYKVDTFGDYTILMVARGSLVFSNDEDGVAYATLSLERDPDNLDDPTAYHIKGHKYGDNGLDSTVIIDEQFNMNLDVYKQVTLIKKGLNFKIRVNDDIVLDKDLSESSLRSDIPLKFYNGEAGSYPDEELDIDRIMFFDYALTDYERTLIRK